MEDALKSSTAAIGGCLWVNKEHIIQWSVKAELAAAEALTYLLLAAAEILAASNALMPSEGDVSDTRMLLVIGLTQDELSNAKLRYHSMGVSFTGWLV